MADEVSMIEEQITPAKPRKNLANCTNVEFLVQTNRIRKQVAEWLKLTDVMKIRKHTATLIDITDDMTPEEKAKAEAENAERIEKQVKKNLSDMLDAALEKNAEKTVELLGLMCFLTPEETKEAKPFYLINNFFEMFNDQEVLGFFSSLMKSELTSLLLSAAQ